jgi:hypothetical protein
MRTLTANVYITKSLPAIDKLFFADHRVESFNQGLKALSETEFEQSFIASPMRNDGLTHFEYSFQANGNVAQGKGVNVVMRLQETSKLLEMFLLENDPLARIIENREEKIDRLKVSSKSKDLLGDPFKGGDVANRLKRSSRYYFAFGTSDHIKDWSGPYSMQLAGATLVNDENNVRSIEVTFVPDTESFKSYSDNLGKLMGFNDDLKNLSQFVTKDSSLHAHAKMEVSRCDNKEYDLDYRIRKLIKQYIGSFTINDGNAVVVLPHKLGTLRVFGKDEANARYDDSMSARAAAQAAASPGLVGAGGLNLGQQGPVPIASTSNREFIPKDSIFSNADEIKQSGILINKFSQFHTFLHSRSLSNATTETRKASVDYLNQILQGASDILGAGGQIQGIARNRRQRLNALSLLDEELAREFERRQERSRDRLIAKAESVKEEAVGKAEIAKAEKIAFLDDLTSTYGVSEVARIILGNFTYYRFIEEILFPVRPPSPGPIPELNLGNARELYVTACNIQLERRIALAQVELEREIEKANALFETHMKPDSHLRKKFMRVQLDRRARKKTLADIESQATGLVSQVKRDLKNSISDRSKKLRKLNTEARWDLLTSPEYVESMAREEFQCLSLSIDSRNLAAQDVHDGFSPLANPLVQFISYIKDKTPKDVKNSYYDFYEETDMRILKLWYANGIISDPTRPAYVFGDVNEVSKILYLEDEDYNEHALNTLFALNKFNDADGRVDTTASSMRSVISSNASEKYAKYVEDFRSEFPQLNTPLKFRHNQEDANVLGLNYRLDNYIVTLLSMPVRSSLDKGAIGTTRLRLARDTVDGAISNQVKNALAKFPSRVKSDINNLAATLIDANSTSTDLLLAIANDEALVRQKSTVDLFSFLYFIENFDEIASKVALSQDVHVSKPSKDKPRFDQYYEAILDLTKKLLYRTTVRTLPIFNQKSYLKRKCVLEGTTGGIIGFPERLRQPAPYNGNYTILGYKHVISPSKIYSEFELVREGITPNLEMADVSVKKFLCTILKGKLVGFDKAREKLKAEVAKKSPISAAAFEQTTDALEFLNENEGLLGDLFRLSGGNQFLELIEEHGPYKLTEMEKRIRKALEVMGCK